MKEFFKTVFSFLFLSFLLQNATGQQLVDYRQYLRDKFMRYCESVPREEIFVHTDRENYIAGEDLWFNISLIDRQTSKPSANSKIAYIEILNPENRPVVQKQIKLDQGSGSGQVVLPDTLTSGSYTIRVYTNWMKNFLPGNCFIKNINVYNALRTNSFLGRKNVKDMKPGDTEAKFDNAGLTLTVNNLRADTLEILVSATQEYLYDRGNIIYLFIQTHGNINHISSERIRGVNFRIPVARNELQPGINQITIFDSEGKPVKERFIYTPANKPVVATIESSETYKPREKVVIEINPASAFEGSDLSVSVTPVISGTGAMNISEYMIFASEFGFIPLKSAMNKRVDELPLSYIDSILTTVKSSWIDWPGILSGKIPDFRYRTENEDHYVYGKLIDSRTRGPVPEKLMFLSVPGKIPVFQYARTDNEGNFSFNIPIHSGEKEIVIQPEESENTVIEIESPFSGKYPVSETANETAADPYPAITKLSVNYQVSKIYGSAYKGEPDSSGISLAEKERFYGQPDIELLMKNYILLPVMEEVAFELLPGVFMKNRKTGYEISISDPVTNEIFYKQPLLMIDGVIVNDASIIAGIDPEVVEKIDVIKDKYVVGDCLFYGIINIITKAGDCSNITLPDYAVRSTPRLYDQVIAFSSPSYSTPASLKSRVPDFRNTLYWNPSIQPDKNGKYIIEFRSSDFVSDYVINAEGVTSDGKIVSLTRTFSVK
jgi:hypothetical protein